MSEEIIKRVLNEFGLTEREAEIYIFLAKHGVQKGGEISKQTKMPKALVYHILRSLVKKGSVESTLEFPTRFSAVPFESILEMNIKAKREEAALIEKRKNSLLQDWKNINRTTLEPESEKFVVIEGRRRIYSKIAAIVEKTQNNLSAVTTVADLVRAEQFGIIDSINAHPMKSKVEFRFLTEIFEQNLKTIKLLRAEVNAGLNINARNPDLGLPLFPRMVIRDNEEILFFISPRTPSSTKKQEACIFTNCVSLVQAFNSVFEDLWRNSTSFKEKIIEIESGKPTPKTLVIADAETAKKKYSQTVNMAKAEIILMTSARDLIQLVGSTFPYEELAKRGISIKIMAPITKENFDYAEQMSKYCAVKHVVTCYLGTTIVDGKHLFQLKASSLNQQPLEQTFSFDNAFYTTDSKYVQKIKNMLEDTWNNAYELSTATLYPILRAHSGGKRTLDIKRDLNTLPERLLNAAKVHKGIARAVVGEIIITPPKHLKMPDIRIIACNFDKESELGEGDLLRVDLWLKTPKGEAFVPVAIVTDAIPEVAARSKVQFAGLPAGQNVISVKPEELQIWTKEKSLFAGWTIPIPLLPPKHVLDPACVLFEVFGDELHLTTSHVLPSGWVMGTEWDGFQALTTFIGTSWKYSGPGISGSVGNMILIEARPETS